MARRSLTEAITGSGLIDEKELKEFVFGGKTPATTTPNQIGSRLVVPRSSIHLTFSFSPDHQPIRYYYDTEELRQWAESDIAVNGIQSPLWVRPLPGGGTSEYELVAGLRRYKAAEIIDLDEIPVIIYNWTDEAALSASLSENANRRDFSPLEHLDGTLKLLAVKLDCTIEATISLLYRMNNEAKGNVNQNVLVNPQYEAVIAVFAFLGQISWQSFVSTRLPLLKKPEEILDAIRQGKIQYTKGLAIAKVKDASIRQVLLTEVIANNFSLTQIQERIKALSPLPENTTLKQRFTETYKRINSAKVWNDSKKQKRLEKLLVELNKLASGE